MRIFQIYSQNLDNSWHQAIYFEVNDKLYFFLLSCIYIFLAHYLGKKMEVTFVVGIIICTW
jgi:hypothetical protein